jgi:hypothetical protein
MDLALGMSLLASDRFYICGEVAGGAGWERGNIACVPCERSFFLWPRLPRRTRDGLEVDWDGEAARNFSFLDVVGTMVWFHAWIRNAFKINHTWAVFG